MAIPDYETMMQPIMELLNDGREKSAKEIMVEIVKVFKLTQEDIKELIPSGRGKLLNNRVGWACTYLRKAGLIKSPKRAINIITDEGRKVLKENKKVDNTLLKNYEQFNEFSKIKKKESSSDEELEEIKSDKTPEEIIGIQSKIIKESLKKDILDLISDMDPSSFEQLVVDLLLLMGYGGSVEDAGRSVGQTNDGGIDGVIKEDVLGLDTIYIQAKRWKNTVPIKEVRDFAGALLSKRSNKGVFITTSNFPPSAEEFVNSIDRKIILIDGDMLAALMIEYELGVSTKDVIKMKEIDSDYFTS